VDGISAGIPLNFYRMHRLIACHLSYTLQPTLPPLVVGGKEVTRQEVAVCDLSGGATKWKVQQKQVVTIR
jgi:hypothetical protein